MHRRKIGGNRDRVVADFFGGGAEPRRIAGDDGNARAFANEGMRSGQAQPLASPRHQADLAVKATSYFTHCFHHCASERSLP